jgi:NAD+ synthase
VKLAKGLLEGLRLEADAVLEVIERGLRREVERVGFERVILGLSGGLDSALTAFLAARTFGAEKVIAVAMPYRSSHPDSLAHAELAASQLGVELRVEPITEQVDAYFRRHEPADSARRGNKMARERMTILYDLSMAERALVLGTSNKTELLLGYSTIFGDSASAVNPIGDLYKTQVRQLALELGVPDAILRKAPSADLWPGQTDEAEAGFTYHELDRLLYWMIDRRRADEELVTLGFDAATVARVGRMVAASEFKRQVPPIAKLGPRTAGVDYLYPRRRPGSART